MRECEVTKIESKSGMFADINIETNPETVPGPGLLKNNRCMVGIKFIYSTGLQEIALAGAGAKFELKGKIGNGASGSLLISSGCEQFH